MPKKSLTMENRELAFRVYLSCGGNAVETLKELAREGLKLTERTLREWRKKYYFDERLARADAMLLAESRGVQTTIVSFLMARAKHYMDYLEGNPSDHQATFAFLSVLKQLAKYVKIEPHGAVDRKVELETMRARAMQILEEEYGITRFGKGV